MTPPVFFLPEVAVALRLHEQMKDPVRWLTKQIKTGNVKARRVGRSWAMTEADIDAALEAWASPVRRRESNVVGLSAASQRRRAS